MSASTAGRTPLTPGEREEATELARVGNREDVADKLRAAVEIFGRKVVLESNVGDDSPSAVRSEVELHTWRLASGEAYFALVESIAYAATLGGDGAAEERVCVTEYNLDRGDVRNAVVRVLGLGDVVMDSQEADRRWVASAKYPRLNTAANLSKFNHQLADSVIAWALAVRDLRELDPRPFMPPKFGWREL